MAGAAIMATLEPVKHHLASSAHSPTSVVFPPALLVLLAGAPFSSGAS